MFKTVIKAGAIATTLLVSHANASIMQYQYTGVGSGTLGTEAFSDSAFVINQLVDTTNIQSCGSTCSFIDDISTTITLAGFGTYSFATGLRTFDNTGMVGLSREGVHGLDLYNIFRIDTTWDMATPTAVIANPYANLIQWTNSPVLLDNAKQLTFTTGGNGSFQAIAAVPEPEQWAMMLLGLPLMGWVARRKRHQALS